MRQLIAISIVVTVWGFNSLAHETDFQSAVSQDQIDRAGELPKTVIIRQSKSEPNQIEVVHLAQAVPPGKKLKGLNFEKIALNSETVGIAFSGKGELDKSTSTAAWGFGYGGWGGYRGGWGGYRGGWGGYRGGWGGYYGGGYYGGGGYPNYGYGYYPNYGSGYYPYNGNRWAYPSYWYSGYQYNYVPYWGYSDSFYNYAYCRWPYGF